MMVDFTQRLPIELLEGILAHASVLDILRVKLVREPQLVRGCVS